MPFALADVYEYTSSQNQTSFLNPKKKNIHTTTLYFWLLRIVSIINMGSCSKWGGLGINLIFYCMLYIALWIFFERTGELNSLTHLNILLAVVTILVHSTTLSEALMIRMYLMFSLFQIVFCLYLIKRYAFWTDDFTIISCNARVIDTFLLLDMVGPFFSSLFGLFGDCDTESKKQVESQEGTFPDACIATNFSLNENGDIM